MNIPDFFFVLVTPKDIQKLSETDKSIWMPRYLLPLLFLFFRNNLYLFLQFSFQINSFLTE